jgi:4-amino-4-deoxy-L-arabinose transferase-like glycosyltransferase
VLSLVAIFAIGIAMRTLWLRADPPVFDPVGIVWHDEGAWVHNARNQALWGVWRTDAWNPVFVTPVFTALEYGAFKTLGVGLWQARTVPVISGIATIAFLIIGLHAIAGRRAAATGGLLLATAYAFVMWNRAALMESTMTAAIAGSWAAYALSARRATWAIAAGILAILAWFTKAAAAFFIAALILDALTMLTSGRRWRDASRSAAWMTIAGTVVAGLAFAAAFVLPHWYEYRFYNWQMSVTRKPDYSWTALLDRASWLPVVQSVFSRMWIIFAVAMAGLVAIVGRWRDAHRGERLLALWVLIGLAELIVHDSGNERRYVMFIPALIALASLVLTQAWPLIGGTAPRARWQRVVVVPLGLLVAYLVVGSLLRPVFIDAINSGHLRTVVRLSAGLAFAGLALTIWKWNDVVVHGRRPLSPVVAAWCVALTVAGQLADYAIWARHRDELNYRASVEIGRLLPAGTLVQGKLANGLALDNHIRPLFVGNGFGNYDDRLRRTDARYILTYDLPRIGFESSDGSGLIQTILDRYPRRRVVISLDVDETPAPDRATLIDKFPAGIPIDARD